MQLLLFQWEIPVSCFALLDCVPDYMQPGGRQAAEKKGDLS